MEFSRYMSVLKITSDFLTTISNSLAQIFQIVKSHIAILYY
jgi:hypothetical protein